MEPGLIFPGHDKGIVMQPISAWPVQERPREKLVSKGVGSLSNPELLAIFLRTGSHGKSAVNLAQDLINEFKGLRGLVEASQDRFCEMNGLGPAKYCQIQAAIELGRRYLEENLQHKDILQCSKDTKAYLSAQLCAYPHEVFACLFLNSQHQIISFDRMFNGTIDGASIYPREIVKKALSRNAAAVILAHNHPSGAVKPSRADIDVTSRLKEALELVDVRVLDHFIVGGNSVISFAEEGLI